MVDMHRCWICKQGACEIFMQVAYAWGDHDVIYFLEDERESGRG